jgi:hypothetical protein
VRLILAPSLPDTTLLKDWLAASALSLMKLLVCSAPILLTIVEGFSSSVASGVVGSSSPPGAGFERSKGPIHAISPETC